MKYCTILFLLVALSLSAQNEQSEKKYEREGKLTKVTTFHANNAIAQVGYFKNSKRHGMWISYDATGKKLSMGNYKKGKRQSKWFFWNAQGLHEVDYVNNRITKSIRWDATTAIAEVH